MDIVPHAVTSDTQTPPLRSDVQTDDLILVASQGSREVHCFQCNGKMSILVFVSSGKTILFTLKIKSRLIDGQGKHALCKFQKDALHEI